ncbi:MAG: hypothetical protein U5P41_07530 [Gammaproteobacteria bacterium]|nr:hypothetical protein [Gammaproteobacteria bacterium]
MTDIIVTGFRQDGIGLGIIHQRNMAVGVNEHASESLIVKSES